MKNRERVSDILIKFLENKAIEKVFLLSGGMMMHLLDSVSKSKKINYYCFHHEQAATMAAESYSLVSNKTGVCFATSGPGSTNTITGIQELTEILSKKCDNKKSTGFSCYHTWRVRNKNNRFACL